MSYAEIMRGNEDYIKRVINCKESTARTGVRQLQSGKETSEILLFGCHCLVSYSSLTFIQKYFLFFVLLLCKVLVGREEKGELSSVYNHCPSYSQGNFPMFVSPTEMRSLMGLCFFPSSL